ncbi:MAG: hypothetical protein IPK69_07310 [Phycisphaerales bacterium]|nr:MAG: hypothetical protein IPK69_07310 [Phycisphaerales bacterium]
MIIQSRVVRFAPVAVAAIVVGAFTLAGPLNPPAGPIAGTGKTTQEIFDKVAESEPRIAINATNTPGDANSLFKITQPGSYYLTGNITGEVGKHGIEIASSDVTINLMGFTLAGVAGSLDGVNVAVTFNQGLCVRNGTVRGWGDEGVDFGTGGGIGGIVVEVRAIENLGNGIALGSNAVVSGCTTFGNSQSGFLASLGCTISNSTAANNLGSGFSLSTSCTVSNCTSYNNGLNGFSGGTASTLTACTALSNTQNGFSTGDRCSLQYCTAEFNSMNGILAGSGCTVIDCIATNSTLNGIQVLNDCTVRGNLCDTNGFGPGDGAGILVTGGDNVIDANKCSGNDRGIDVNAGGNLIIKNQCSGNTTNWDIVISNAVAPIVNASTNAAVITGNSYAGNLGSTDPNANFTY